MSLSLAAPYAGERILVFGPEGVGKTFAALRAIEVSKDAKGFYLDTDRAVRRMLNSQRWEDLWPRLEVVSPRSWPEYVEAGEKWLASASQLDWLVVDLFGRAWDTVQEHFTEQVFGLRHDEHLLGYRKQLEAADRRGSKSEFDVSIDWPVVKGMYRRLTNVVLDWPGHVYLACGKKSINDQYDDASTKERYRPVGCKPDAEKTAAHLVHTVLHLAPNLRFTTIKDRERKLLDGVKVADFALGYLVGVAGWRPG